MAGSFRPGICGRKAAIAPPIAAITAKTPAKIATFLTLSLPPSLLDRSFNLSLLESWSLGALALGVTEVVLVRPCSEENLFSPSLTLSLDLSNLSLISLLGSLALSSTLGASELGFTSTFQPCS